MFSKVLCAALFIVLATTFAAGEISTKSEFAKKYEDAFRREVKVFNAKMLHIRATYFADLLSMLGPNFKYAANFKERIDGLERLKANLLEKHYTDEELVALIEFIIVYSTFIGFVHYLEGEEDIITDAILIEGIAKRTYDEDQAAEVLAITLKTDWDLLYNDASPALLEENKEFSDINDIFKEIGENKSDNYRKLYSAMEIAFKFFDSKVWLKLHEGRKLF